MSKVIVKAFSVSLDGFGAGPDQSLQLPLGVGGEGLHTWIISTRMFGGMSGQQGGSIGVDNDIAEQSMENLGAWIMGRNMFGPVRGPWPDREWEGWWGKTPPYHCPVFVLTHHEREPLEMDGGTTFYFITDGIDAALRQAKKVAGAKDIRIGGGAETIRQFLKAGLIDEMQLTFSPVMLGRGESLFSGIDLPALGFNRVEHIMGEKAIHLILKKN